VTLRAVVFDAGGVLVRIAPTWAECLDAAGIPRPATLDPLARHIDCPEFLPYQAGRLDEATYYEGLGRFLGLTAAQAEQVHLAMLIEPYPGTETLAESLHAQGIVTGLLSNTNEPHWREMRHGPRFAGIAACRVAVASHRARMEKPGPDIYRHWQEQAAVPAESILFFDDHPDNVEGARAVGWTAYRIDPDDDPARQIKQTLAERGIRLA
jgi:putative hydrolase of the HAD superfamily